MSRESPSGLTSWQVSTYVNWTGPGGHLQAGLTAENDYGSLPWGSFVTRLYQVSGVYSFTPDLVLSTYVQYDTESRDLGVNGRLRWTIRPGADVFLVWNRGWVETGVDRYRLPPVAEQVVLRLRWTLRP